MTQTIPFIVPPASGGHVCIVPEIAGMPAKATVNRLRENGFDAFAERNAGSSARYGFYTYGLYVARSQFLPALIAWRLGRKTKEKWDRAPFAKRRRLATKALLDGAIMQEGDWNPTFCDDDLRQWLRNQLSLDEAGVAQLMEEAACRYRNIGWRDIVLGTSLTVALFIVGWRWGRFDVTGELYATALLALSAVIGGHTLLYSLPRLFRRRHAPPSSTAPQRRMSDQSTRLINDVRDDLNRDDPMKALRRLENYLAAGGEGTAAIEKLLSISRKGVGDADGGATPRGDDWVGALKKGEALLAKGDAKGALSWFRRSVATNPGEPGTIAGERAAEQGIEEAKKRLG